MSQPKHSHQFVAPLATLLILVTHLAAGPARAGPATYAPSFFASHRMTVKPRREATTLRFIQSVEDLATAHVRISAPVGVRRSAAIGERIGTASARVQLGSMFGGMIVGISGSIIAADPRLPRYAEDPCNPDPADAAVWIASFTEPADQAQSVPMYVFLGPASTGPTAAIYFCLPDPSLLSKAGRIVEETVRLLNRFIYYRHFRWTVLNVPWSTRHEVDLARAVETQSVDPMPIETIVHGSIVRSTSRTRRSHALRAAIHGSVNSVSTNPFTGRTTRPVAAARVIVLAGKKKKRLRTRENGSFRTIVTLRRAVRYQIRVSAAARLMDNTPCDPPDLPVDHAGRARCGAVTAAGFNLQTPRFLLRLRST